MKFKIAVVQLEIKQYQPEINLKRAEQFISTASSMGADVIIFPEDFITGPLIKRLEFADNEKKYRNFFQNVASKYKIDIIPGSFIENDKGSLYNTSYYIDRTGKVKGRYRKINLWHPERKYLTAGNQVSVFNTRFGKAGLIICWDLIFPEIFRKMIKKGVQIVYCPSYWCLKDAGEGVKYDPASEIKNVRGLCLARAFEQEIILVYSNAAGKLLVDRIKDDLIGQSQITVPFKGILKLLEHNKEQMFIQEVDTNILKLAEKTYRIREDLNSRVI